MATDPQLWIPLAAVCAFMVAVLLPGLLLHLFRKTAAANAILRLLRYRPMLPRQPASWHAWTLDIVPAICDLTLADVYVILAWLAACMSMMLSPTGNKLGRICVVAMATIMFPITKNSMWMGLFHSSFERVIRYHRWGARATMIILLAHMIDYFLKKKAKVFTISPSDSKGLGGVFGFVSYVIMVFISILAIEPIRRRFFELFYYPHLLGFVAIGLAMVHSYAMCYAMIPPLALLLLDKLITFIALSRTHKMVSTEAVHGGTRVVVENKKGTVASFRPGQYYFLIVPAVSHLQMHPFSAIRPTEDGSLTLLMKDTPFTKRIPNIKKGEDGVRVRLSGPFGTLSLPKSVTQYPMVYLVAGGAGATPMISVAQTFMLEPMAGREVHFVWVARDSEVFTTWCPDILMQMLDTAGFFLHLYSTQPVTEELQSWPEADYSSPVNSPLHDIPVPIHQNTRLGMAVTYGRPDWDTLFAEPASRVKGAEMAVLVCGPESMVCDVQRRAQPLHCNFHKEVFCW